MMDFQTFQGFFVGATKKYSFLSSLSANPYLRRPLLFYMPCQVRLSLISFLNGTTNSAISSRTLWIISLAGEDQQQTNQLNDLANG